MKIAFVLHGFPPELSGGTERTVEALARAMQGAGHEVFVICGSMQVASTRQVDEIDLRGLRVLRVHRDDLYFESWFKCYHPGLSETLSGIFQSERPDIVHVHHWLRLTSDVARLARRAGAVAAITVHDYFPVLARVARRVGEDRVSMPDLPAYMSAAEGREAFEFHRRDMHDELASAQLLLVPSHAHGEGLRAMAPAPLPEPMVTPPPLLDPPGRRQQARDPARRRLLCWGSVYAEKGLRTVLEAMVEVSGEVSLAVFGEVHDQAYRTELEGLAAGLEVEFHGAFTPPDLGNAAADFAVLPSLCHESYGLILDEALCLGLPVIASDLPAYREHAPADACVFFAPGDAARLAQVLNDEAGLAALQEPVPPELAGAEASARQLLAAYEGVDRSAPTPDAAISDRSRARQLFRRAERRLWSMLQQPKPPQPPDDFLAE